MPFPPLYIYVIRHNDSKKDTESLLESIYSTLARDTKNPLARNIGISVFSIVFNNHTSPFQIDFKKAERIIVLPLIDDNAICDDAFISYLESIYAEVNTNVNHLFIPIAFSPNAFKINSPIINVNAIRLFDLGEKENYIKLRISLLHEICRHLFSNSRVELSNEPIYIFISHAKNDGATLSSSLKCFFEKLTAAKTFFDVNDIAPGYDFENEIVGNINKSILLINYTDSYSSREWCRKEILTAKRAKVPILLINSLNKYDTRNFPYSGNSPVIKWDSEKSEEVMFSEVAFELMYQTLLCKYSQLNATYVAELYGQNTDKTEILSCPPELLTMLHIDKSKELIIYPDPPLGKEEIEILKQIDPQRQFVTPVLLPSLAKQNKNIDKLRIGISISESNDMEVFGFSKYHVRDALIEFARYLLSSGNSIVYGGDVRYNADFNFAQFLIDILGDYNSRFSNDAEKISNYCGYPLSENISTSDRANLKNTAKFMLLKRPVELNDSIFSCDELMSFTKVEHQYGWAISMTEMRETMNNNIDARIIMAGKTFDYKGKLPGVIEEAYMCLRDKKPLYILGAFGGAGKVLKEALLGEKPAELTSALQSKYSKFPEFESYFNERVGDDAKIDYDLLVNYFNNAGLKSLNNGLSESENIELLNCVDLHKAVSIVLKGLNDIQNKGAGLLNT